MNELGDQAIRDLAAVGPVMLGEMYIIEVILGYGDKNRKDATEQNVRKFCDFLIFIKTTNFDELTVKCTCEASLLDEFRTIKAYAAENRFELIYISRRVNKASLAFKKIWVRYT